MPSTKVLLVALAAAFHSFTSVLAAEDPQITPAPTPTTPERRQVAGASGTPILSTLHFAFTDIPYQVYPFAVLRGPQFGFNICNSTTLGPTSNCQTLIFNSPVGHFSSWLRTTRVRMFARFVDTTLWEGTRSLIDAFRS